MQIRYAFLIIFNQTDIYNCIALFFDGAHITNKYLKYLSEYAHGYASNGHLVWEASRCKQLYVMGSRNLAPPTTTHFPSCIHFCYYTILWAFLDVIFNLALGSTWSKPDS